MSVTLIKQPPYASLSKNQIVFGFSVSNPKPVSIYPILTLEYTGYMSNGDTVNFRFINPDTGHTEIIKFEAKTVPSQNGVDLPTGTGFTSVTLYAQEIAKYIRANTLVSRYYLVSLDGDNVLLMAKQGIKELVPTSTTTSGGEPSLSSFSQYYNSVESIKSKKVSIKVYVEELYNSNSFVEVSHSFVPIDQQGNAYVNIEDVIHTELVRNELSTLPPYTGDVWIQNTNRKYYLKYALTVDNEIINEETETLPYLAVLGGISISDEMIQSPFDYLLATKKFLNWQPTTKKITPTESEYISWINYLNKTASIRLKVVLHFNDGTVSLQTLNQYDKTLSAYEIVTFDISFSTLGISSFETSTKKIIKWNLFIESSAFAFVSEKKEFYLDRSFVRNARDIVYLNSFSMPEVIHTHGKWTKGLEVARDISSKILSNERTTINGQEFQFNQESRNNYTARTSFLTKSQSEAFEEVVLEALLFVQENGEYYPLLLIDKKFQTTEDDTPLHFYELALKKGFKVSRYSKLSKLPEFIPTINCGLEGYTVNTKGLPIFSYGGLTVFDQYGTSVSTATWNATTKKYVLTNKITKQGNYRVEVDLVVTIGGTPTAFPYYFTYQQLNESVTIKFNGVPSAVSFAVSGHSSTDIYVDKFDGAGPTQMTLSTVSTIINHGTDRIKISTPCASVLKQILCTGSNVLSINYSLCKNLEELRLFTNDLSGTLNVEDLDKVKIINLQGNPNLTGLALGAPTGLTTLNMKTTGLVLSGVDALLRDLWNKRNIFINALAVDISSNSFTLTPELNDLINGTNTAGTGKYTGDGLAQNGIAVTI